MIKKYSLIFLLLGCLGLVSCSQAKNYKEAYGLEINRQTFIKLKGRREYMVHDPVSLLKNKTYEDSLLIPVPSLEDGVIKGKDIPVKKGYYKYLGDITIKNGKIKVNLSYDNYDDKVIQPISWNGDYELKKD